MDTCKSGHRRRRSSLMNSLDSTTLSRKRGHSRKTSSASNSGRGDRPDALPGETFKEDSTSEEMEFDELSDDGLQVDEEMGLTGRNKGKRNQRLRKNILMDQRFVPDSEVTAEERKEADQNVIKESMVNCLLIGLWYLFSLSISIYNKWMFDPKHLNFHFPLFTTSFHILVQFVLASLVLHFLPQFGPRYDSDLNPINTLQASNEEILQNMAQSRRSLMTRMFYFTRIGPCGVATGLDIGLGNMSLYYITLTFYTMCKSSSLAFVLLFAFLFCLETPSVRLVLIIATMTIGVLMMVAGETTFSPLGFTLVISAAFFSGFRWALTQILLLRNPATSNPFSSIFFLAPVMFASLILLAVPVEGFPSLIAGFQLLIERKGIIIGPLLLLFPGVIAFCMTASEFALLQRTSVVTLSIAGIFKEVVTISAAGLVFHDRLTLINISGLIVTISAIAAYNYMKIRKMREDAQEEVHKSKLDDQVHSESDADREGSDSDWNTADGTYVTVDGDVLPAPESVEGKIAGLSEGSKKSGTDKHASDIIALAVHKKESSD